MLGGICCTWLGGGKSTKGRPELLFKYLLSQNSQAPSQSNYRMTRFKLKFKEAHEALGLGKVAIRKFCMLLSHTANSKAPVLVGWKYLADGQPGVQIHLAKVT